MAEEHRAKIAFIGRWGQACGVSTYTEQLAVAVQHAGYGVVAIGPALCDESGSTMVRKVPDITSEYVWRRGQGSVLNADFVPAVLKRHDVQVADFQHEFGIWDNDEAFLQMLRTVSSSGVKVIVTLHTVWAYGSPTARQGFFERLGKIAHVIIVHTPSAYAAVIIACRTGGATVQMVPHGTPEEIAGNRDTGRNLLQVPTRFKHVMLVQGLISPGKNIMGTIFAFASALRAGWIPGGVCLIVSGKVLDPGYLMQIMQAIDATGYAPMIMLREGFTPPDKMCHIMAAASCAVLNTTSDTLSASGAVHAHAAHAVPVAVAAKPIYMEAIQAGALPFSVGPVPYEPTNEAICSVAALCSSENIRRTIRQSMVQWAKYTRWSKLVESYYQEIFAC